MNDLDLEKLTKDRASREGNHKAMVQAYYHLITTTYRQFWGDSYHFALFAGSETREEALVETEKMIARNGGFEPGMKVLDVGCGLGGPALTIAEYSGARVTGLDIYEPHVRIAQRRAAERGLAARTCFLAADAMDMPFPDASFERVYVFEAGCHAPDKRAFYRECARVLRPGGEFLGLDWMRGEGLNSWEEEAYIEPICRYACLPNMITLTELKEHLAVIGLQALWTEDLSIKGHILRNWDPLSSDVLWRIQAAASDSNPLALWRVTQSGIALARAARCGAFIIGHWRALKPQLVADRECSA